MDSVRKIIRETLEEMLINERLMDINDDVDFIYDTYFKDDFEEIERTGELSEDMFKEDALTTFSLKSELAKEANELNPCKIVINVYGNFYRPKDSVISIGVNKNAVDFINREGGGSIEKAVSKLDQEQAERLPQEYKPSSIKGSIKHELVHWIDDTLHNKHILKKVKKASERGFGVNAEKFEIQAQIHNIEQLKRKYESIWDGIGFMDMLKLSPALGSMYNNLPYELKSRWVRDIKTRMYREGLLGAMMANN